VDNVVPPRKILTIEGFSKGDRVKKEWAKHLTVKRTCRTSRPDEVRACIKMVKNKEPRQKQKVGNGFKIKTTGN